MIPFQRRPSYGTVLEKVSKIKRKLPAWYQLRKVTTTLTVSGNGITDVTERCISKGGQVQLCTYVRHIWVQS